MIKRDRSVYSKEESGQNFEHSDIQTSVSQSNSSMLRKRKPTKPLRRQYNPRVKKIFRIKPFEATGEIEQITS